MQKNQEQFTITRIFDAPRERVWQAWTDPKLFGEWFGPKGFTAEVRTMDVREGGALHCGLTPPGGQKMWAKFVYREVKAPARLSWEHFFSDEKGGVTRHPFQANWPLKLLTTVVLEPAGNQTRLTLTWIPLEPTDAERKAFEENFESMNQGWGGTFEQLEDFLGEAKAA